MKMNVSSLLMICVAPLLVFRAHADPILPYQRPIEQQLTNDINAGTGDANTLNKALDTYHRTSKNLNGDISILRDLNKLLAETPNYPALLADAASAYLLDFEIRQNVLTEQLRPAPLSSTRTSAEQMLAKIDKALSNAEIATVTSQRIKHLQTAAMTIPPTSNTVQKALKAKVGRSQLSARIGVVKSQSSKGGTTGGTIQTTAGNGIGEFDETQRFLSFSAFDSGNIARGIHLHVEGISPLTPMTYPLGVDQNFAFYDATDTSNGREYHFVVAPNLTNSTVTNASLTIDYIGTNYVLGRFAFIGTNVFHASDDTNNTVTVSQGRFQLNFIR